MERRDLTPLFQQYYDLREAHPGCLLLMQVGDFYEAYGEDAELLARELEIALTSKEAGAGRRLAMSGVPVQAVDPYLKVLIDRGYRVAVADQVEDARQARGLVRREVVRVITSGTVLDPAMLDEKSHNFLVCLAPLGEAAGLAAADITTGDFACTEVELLVDRVVEEVSRYAPAEVVLAPDPRRPGLLEEVPEQVGAAASCLGERPHPDRAEALLREPFGLETLKGCDLEDRPAAVLAGACLLRYLQETHRCRQITLDPPRGYSTVEGLVLDATTRRNLELTETLLGRKRRGSLLGTVDLTCTSMGARTLQRWMLRPLVEEEAIRRRHRMVAALVESYGICLDLRQRLGQVLDVERLAARAVSQSANARDLVALRQSLQALPALRETLHGVAGELAEELLGRLDPHTDLCALLERALVDDPPVTLREGGLIREGYDGEIDRLRGDRARAREWIASLQERERQRTGIRSLKVGYNQVFGYYLEVTRANYSLVPEEYVRKQTLANAERYFTPELKEYEARVLGADDRLKELEYERFVELRREVARRAPGLRGTARALGELDTLCAFAEAAVRWDWCRPEVVPENLVDLEEARHPVVEHTCPGAFVPNHCRLDSEQRLVILTGPNMSGKSTYLRQVALIQLLAQMGSFVPARRARLGVADRIFTRVGASDDLHLGQSTFMVEMAETANILNHATPRSLVILDEIGRGTSTFDGLAIARAVAEHLHDEVKARTLFATHFHELTCLERTLKGCRNYRVAVRESRDEVVFLHRIVRGGADRSYGIYVARLAGVPQPVLERARELLRHLERQSRRRAASGDRPRVVQMGLFSDAVRDLLLEELRALDPEALTPEEALERIRRWHQEAFLARV